MRHLITLFVQLLGGVNVALGVFEITGVRATSIAEVAELWQI